MERFDSNPGAAGRRRRAATTATRLAPAGVALVTILVVGVTAVAGPQRRPMVYAITGATVITEPGTTIENATVVLRDGLIEAVGANLAAPADAEVIDGSEMTVYAGWIDAYTNLALKPQPAQQQDNQQRGRPQAAQEPEPGTGHPISPVHPEYSVTEDLISDDGDIDDYRALGFGAALVVPRDGIYRGQGAVIALREGNPRALVIRAGAAQNVGYRGGSFRGAYPGSLMGVITTIRQVLLDSQRAAQWAENYERNPAGIQRPEFVDAYAALQPVLAGEEPVIFDATNNRNTERSLRISQEFGLQPIIKGNGREYDVAAMLAEAQADVIIPVNYPKKPEVGDDDDANLDVSLATLRGWDMAPRNAATLEEAGVSFAFTTAGLNGPGDFVDNVRKAIEAGLSEDAALAAVTTAPARMLGIDSVLGSIEAGKIANLVVATGTPFGEETEIRHVFVDGFHTEIKEEATVGDPNAEVDPRGTWEVTMAGGEFSTTMTWIISGSPGSYSGSAEGEMGSLPFTRVRLKGNAMTVAIQSDFGAMDITVLIEGETLSGTFDIPDAGMSMGISGRRISGPGSDAALIGGSR